MRIGEIYRYARPYDHTKAEIQGVPNYFHKVHAKGMNKAVLEKGINPIKEVIDKDGLMRRPAILISSSPHKAGTEETPWQDVFDPDRGHIQYYGDNKDPNKNPSESEGNKVLIESLNTHLSPIREQKELREEKGVPIIYFLKISHAGKVKGYRMFQGFGIIESANLITQFDRKHGRYFTNYVFDFVVFSLTKENETFPWEWINDRRNPEKSMRETLRLAPESWKEWVKHCNTNLEKCRRRVSKLQILSSSECVFRSKPNSDSALNRTAIPEITEH